MTSEWKYQIPTARRTRWANTKGPKYANDTEWPRVGIYCNAPSHDPIWLVGSFCLDPELLEQRDIVYWAWEAKYPTGDGQLIQLKWQGRERGVGMPQYLVGDRLHHNPAVHVS